MNTNVLRYREYRQRRKLGRACFEIEADEIALTDALTLAGFLPADREPDHVEIVTALERVIALWIAQEQL